MKHRVTVSEALDQEIKYDIARLIEVLRSTLKRVDAKIRPVTIPKKFAVRLPIMPDISPKSKKEKKYQKTANSDIAFHSTLCLLIEESKYSEKQYKNCVWYKIRHIASRVERRLNKFPVTFEPENYFFLFRAERLVRTISFQTVIVVCRKKLVNLCRAEACFRRI